MEYTRDWKRFMEKVQLRSEECYWKNQERTMKDYILKDSNDLFTYYEVMNQMEAKCILDVGMFLKRVGSLTRDTVGEHLPENAFLSGIDIAPEIKFPAWSYIYDKIQDISDFLEKESDITYDISFFLGMKGLLPENVLKELIDKVSDSAEYVLIDDTIEEWDVMSTYTKKVPFEVEGKMYYLLNLKGSENEYKNICYDA